MFDALKTIAASKKFWLTIIGSAVTAATASALALLGVSHDISLTITTAVAGLFGTSVLGQGLADQGKNSK